MIPRYPGCGVWVFATFWGIVFQLEVSPFNWIDKIMEDVGGRRWGRC
jgi:hypothetical protein